MVRKYEINEPIRECTDEIMFLIGKKSRLLVTKWKFKIIVYHLLYDTQLSNKHNQILKRIRLFNNIIHYSIQIFFLSENLQLPVGAGAIFNHGSDITKFFTAA